MKGQWLGQFTGTNPGFIIFNVDEVEDHYEGRAILHFTWPAAQSAPLPISIAFIKTSDKSSTGQVNAAVTHHDPQTDAILQQTDLASRYPGWTFPDQASARYALNGGHLDLSWTTNVGTSGQAKLPSAVVHAPSPYSPQVLNWTSFKQYVDQLPFRKRIFRGQDAPHRLRTTYHRTGRADLQRYVNLDMQALHGALAARTRHQYDLSNHEENAAFLHLAQHHGYPTPLLDWTHSPYVAAFCAFRTVPVDSKAGAHARIFVFDPDQWQSDCQQIMILSTSRLHLSVIEAISYDNDRSQPQQSLSLVTNIDDIESYVQTREGITKKQYLSVIDVPCTERATVMRDLSRMGISAGSMFPGLDGACEELRERLFFS